MRIQRRFLRLSVIALAAFAVPLYAQQSTADPELTRDIKVISSAGARALADACTAWAEKNKLIVAMAILDWGGNVIESHCDGRRRTKRDRDCLAQGQVGAALASSQPRKRTSWFESSENLAPTFMNDFPNPARCQSCSTVRSSARWASRAGEDGERCAQAAIDAVFKGKAKSSTQIWIGEGGKGRGSRIPVFPSNLERASAAYEIVAAIGAGGMGEVYRARDTKLNRDVAIKVLPDAFAADPERLARFEREAQTLASLNHPNIAAIYGLEDIGGARSHAALVMELVEGEDACRSDRAAARAARRGARRSRGRSPTRSKPRTNRASSIAISSRRTSRSRADGTVKVLDFGLAKALDDPRPQSSVRRCRTRRR